MMSGRAIRQLSDEAAAKARSEGKLPVVFNPEHYDNARDFTKRIPFVGSWRPKGYSLERTLFVDKTGLGRLGEPALTLDQFWAELEPGKAYAVVEAGQFQVRVGEFSTFSPSDYS